MTTGVSLSTDLFDRRAQYLSTDEEVDRDLLLHYICKATLNGNFSCPFDNSMKKCLDIGYSSGYWMMEAATDFPKCQFYGIDIEPNSPDLVHPPNCLFQQGNYLEGLPYPTNTFDVVHVRLLSTMGAPDQILPLLSEISRVTAKGGYIEFLEFDYNSATSPLLGKLMKVFCAGNRTIDRRLDDLLAKFGFANVKTHKVPIPLNRRSMVGEFSMAALKLCIKELDSRSMLKLNISTEEDLVDLIEKECEEYSSHINIISGFSQKL